MGRREVLILGVFLVTLLLLAWFTVPLMYPSLDHPTSGWWKASPSPSPTPEPFEPPAPEPVEDDPPLASQPPLRMMNVCHCDTSYGACRNVAMPVAIAQQFHREHWQDLIDMDCATPAAESYWLRRVLERPEGIHYNTRNRLAMADRAAWRERTRAEAER